MNHQNYGKQNYNKSRYTSEYSKYHVHNNRDESSNKWKYSNNESRYNYNKDDNYKKHSYHYKNSNKDYHHSHDRHSSRDSSEKYEKNYSEDDSYNDRKKNYGNSKFTGFDTATSQKSYDEENNLRINYQNLPYQHQSNQIQSFPSMSKTQNHNNFASNEHFPQKNYDQNNSYYQTNKNFQPSINKNYHQSNNYQSNSNFPSKNNNFQSNNNYQANNSSHSNKIPTHFASNQDFSNNNTNNSYASHNNFTSNNNYSTAQQNNFNNTLPQNNFKSNNYQSNFQLQNFPSQFKNYQNFTQNNIPLQMNQQLPIFPNNTIKPVSNFNNYNSSYQSNSNQEPINLNQNFQQSNYLPNQKLLNSITKFPDEDNIIKLPSNNYISNFNRLSTINVKEIEPKSNILQRKEIKEEDTKDLNACTEDKIPFSENDFRIDNSILATIFASRSHENGKVCSKLLKENLNENTIERDKKLFSSLFTGEKFIEDLIKFSKIQFFIVEENKFPEEKLNNEKVLKMMKNELSIIGRKRISDLQVKRNLRENINKIELSKNLLKIKQIQLQTKLDEIFSDI